MAETAAIRIVERAPDARPDERSGGGTDDDGDGAIFRGRILRADDASDDAANHGSDLFAVTAPRGNLVVALPFRAGVADIRRIILLAPAMGGGVSGRFCARDIEYGHGEHSEKQRQEELVHRPLQRGEFSELLIDA